VKFTIYLTDELHEQVQAAMAEGLNASAVCQDALRRAIGQEPDPEIAWPPGFTAIGRAPGGRVLVAHDDFGGCGAVVPIDKAWDHDNWHDGLNQALYDGGDG
jgi:hypothetical protein